MKLSKKRISILVIICVTLIVGIFTLCSFSPPDFVSTTSLSFSSLSQIDVENLSSIVNLQSSMGYFGAYFPVFCRMRSSGVLSLTCLKKGSSYIFSDAGSRWEFTTTGDVAVFEFTADGFSFASTSTYNPADSELLFYRTYEIGALFLNPDFQYSGSENGDDNISDCLTYWIQFYENTINYESDVDGAFDSGYFEGLESGLSWGEALGYENGYTEGYQEGIGTGYMHGYQAGEADGYGSGYSEGYDYGYDSGYDSGYSDGLDDADPETITIVIYEEPVELNVPGIISAISSIPDSILSGAFDFEFSGINIYGLLKLLIIVFIISAVIFFIIKRSA